MAYREKCYDSFDEFCQRETPTFDHLSDAIDGLMDALFLDEVNKDFGKQRRRRRRGASYDEEEKSLFEEFAEAEWAY